MIFLAVALLAIALATLWPMPATSPHHWVFCLACGDRGASDLLLNIVLFMPLGAALALRGRRLSFSALFAALLSSAIELSQFHIPGRDPTVGDVVANTCGAVLGAWILQRAPFWLSPPTRIASWLCRGATLGAALICLATGLLLTPFFPTSRYYGHLVPQLGDFEWYHGRMLHAAVGGAPIASGPLPEQVRELLQSGAGYELHVRVDAGPQPQGLAPLLAIFDEQRREIVLIGADRDELVLRVWNWAAAWRFDRPDLRVQAPQDVRSGDTLTVDVAARAGRYSINGVDRGFTVGHGWALLAYPDRLPFTGALHAAWIGALFAPAGFWWRTRKDIAIVALGLLSGLLLVPAVTPLVLTPPVQWIAAGAGLGCGASLRRWLLRHAAGCRAGRAGRRAG